MSNIAHLADISFPVYILGKEKPNLLDNVLFYSKLFYETKDTPERYETYIVDDKSLSVDTLAKRRLMLKDKGVLLFRLAKAIYFLGDLIKLTSSGKWIIDSNGKLFQYIKTTKAKLKFHKIQQIVAINTGGAIIVLEDSLTRYKLLYYPKQEFTYAGILHFGLSTILYGLYDQKYKESWRKV